MTDQPEATADLTDNPLLCAEGLPKFDKIKPEHVVPAVKKLLADAEQSLSALEESIEPTWTAVSQNWKKSIVRLSTHGGRCRICSV